MIDATNSKHDILAHSLSPPQRLFILFIMFFGFLRIVLGVNLSSTLSRLTQRTIRREPKNIINRINNLCGGERHTPCQGRSEEAKVGRRGGGGCSVAFADISVAN